MILSFKAMKKLKRILILMEIEYNAYLKREEDSIWATEYPMVIMKLREAFWKTYNDYEYWAEHYRFIYQHYFELGMFKEADKYGNMEFQMDLNLQKLEESLTTTQKRLLNF